MQRDSAKRRNFKILESSALLALYLIYKINILYYNN